MSFHNFDGVTVPLSGCLYGFDTSGLRRVALSFRNEMCLHVSVYENLFLRKAMMWFFMTDIRVRHPAGRCYAT
ncbi:hypothetical protein, partial [Pectobacterium versatile]|uniref:hypothetical protein n=1 Tax=Pectobacterium versatile TaxID=2488639 RepID=UPI001961FE34